MNAAIQLTYGQHVRLTGWNEITTAKVFTVEGYAAKNGSDVASSLERAIRLRHELASTVYTGATLYGDRAEGARANAEARLNVAGAATLAEGDLVEIEGRRYTVRVPRGNQNAPANSDPIHFQPVVSTAAVAA